MRPPPPSPVAEQTQTTAREAVLSRPTRTSQLTPAIPYLLVLPAFVLIGVILIYPSLFNLYLAVWDWSFTMPEDRRFVGLGNFARLLRDPLFWTTMRNTTVFTTGTIALEFLLGLTVALLLNHMAVGRRFVTALVLLPYMTATIVVGLVWRLMWSGEFGLINYFLSLVGLPGIPWLSQSWSAMTAVIVTEVWRSTPFVVMVLLAGLVSMPLEPFEAARVDGAGPPQIFWRITLPLLRPSIAVALLFQTIIKLRVFDLIFILTGGGPGNETLPIGILIYRAYFRYFQGGGSAALAVVLLVLGAIVSAAYIKGVYRQVEY